MNQFIWASVALAAIIGFGILVGYSLGRQTTHKEFQALWTALYAKSQLERYWHNYPRAMKLIEKGKTFVMVSVDEVYFLEVYDKIRNSEKGAGRWTDRDESFYQLAQAEYFKIINEAVKHIDWYKQPGNENKEENPK